MVTTVNSAVGMTAVGLVSHFEVPDPITSEPVLLGHIKWQGTAARIDTAAIQRGFSNAKEQALCFIVAKPDGGSRNR